MYKVTLVFPTHDSLWSFQGQSRAINVAVTPKTNTITALFTSEEINRALLQFGAVQLKNAKNNEVSQDPAASHRSLFTQRNQKP